MSLIRLSEETKRNVAFCTKVKFEEIVNLSPDSELELISRNFDKRVVFSKKRNFKKIGRGNPLLSRKKIRTLDYVENKLARIK